MPDLDAALEILAAPAPCDDCPLRARCARSRLACAAFADYVHGGEWRAGSREPERSTYAEIFGGARRRISPAAYRRLMSAS